ncbi:uncharacterized protein G2W53_007553 [Senna tora]|uniref:Uncharacterized protein n=1 Tax=Senna tora TaxID=362788 RepID=A0A835CF22_9FABA|nr:uncharacterized protein G2W53_007553 [Senna tora]
MFPIANHRQSHPFCIGDGVAAASTERRGRTSDDMAELSFHEFGRRNRDEIPNSVSKESRKTVIPSVLQILKALLKLNEKTNAILKLIEEDADSFIFLCRLLSAGIRQIARDRDVTTTSMEAMTISLLFIISYSRSRENGSNV